MAIVRKPRIGIFGWLLLSAIVLPSAAHAAAQPPELYHYQQDARTVWFSPENRSGAKGAGGVENRGAKGHAWDTIAPGASYVLADVQGAGTIDRIWFTIDDRSPEVLRGLKLEMYWDGAATPAVAVPVGDFFLQGGGEMVPMESALFASPEGRSFISYVKMPFRRRAHLVLTNESAKRVQLFYDVDCSLVPAQPDDALYFHAWWHRMPRTTLGQDFALLPSIAGRGRFLGASITVLTNPAYEKSWWGEGEVKVKLDGDGAQPSLVGTGTEDYIGSAWGQGAYINRYQGAPVATWDQHGIWSFYRFHIPDPIWFHHSIQVTLGQIGGAPKADVIRFRKAGAPLIPITIDNGNRSNGFEALLTSGKKVTDPSLIDGWTNFYRSDDVSAVAYFYADRSDRMLPEIQPAADRMRGLRRVPPKK
ncbi:D-arabinan exo alpha-(1,3)/(1,5)-arabinofuranosidase (non-reducing end) [Sphingomonas sp. F9_3S_D5_B_2]